MSEFVSIAAGETVVAIVAADTAGAGLAIGTAQGVVKRVTPDYPQNLTDFDVIALKDGDRVVGAVQLTDEDQELTFITSDAQLLRFPASSVRPQGRAAGGMAGIRLAPRARVIWFGAVDPAAGVQDAAAGRAGRRAGCGDRGWRGRRAAGSDGGHRQGHPVRGIPAERPGNRRRALSSVPQG